MNQLLWTPKNIHDTNMYQFMQWIAKKYALPLSTYQELHAWSTEEPQYFWKELAEFFNLTFDTPITSILKPARHMIDAEWFVGARMNFAQQLLKRQDNKIALISVNEDNKRHTLTFAKLYQEVSACAALLKAQGIGVNDRVGAVMPNTHHTIIIMLATSALGAVFASCSPDFGIQATVDRLGQIKPKVVFVCDGHQYQGKQHSSEEKIHSLHAQVDSIEHIVVVPNILCSLQLNQLPKVGMWGTFNQPSTDIPFVSLPFNHPLYILFSSGTTGKPKCIVHGAGGTLIQHIKELGLHTNLKEQDNLCFYTTCGWMMWNWMASSLYFGATLTLYEGSPTHPAPNRLFKLIEQEQVTIFGTSAKFISSVEKLEVHACKEANLSKLHTLLSTGSPLLPNHYDYVYKNIKSDILLCSISGGTDIISCFALGNPILPVHKGELQCLGLGMSVEIFNDQGQSVHCEKGELVCTKPFPSMPVGFFADEGKKAYHRAYFERFENIWAHGDFAMITEHQGLIIFGRSDAVLNPGGVRIGTAEIYRQIEQIDEVLDSIAIDQQYQDDVRVLLFVKLKENGILDETLINKIKQTIKKGASPRHVPAKILKVPDIPRTINGKLVELAVRQVVHHEPISNLSSIANPEALEYFKDRIELS